VTTSSLAADPDLRLSVSAGNIAKPKRRSGPYHRLRDSAYGGSSSDLTAAEGVSDRGSVLRPVEPSGLPPEAGGSRERAQAEGVKVAINTAQEFEAVQDSSLALCVESGEPGQAGSSAEQTLLHWIRNQPGITEMLDEQVGCVFHKVPGCTLGGNCVYKSVRAWYWWYYSDIMCSPEGHDRSGWYLSKELWGHMSTEVEDMI
jgi:hypothetical protein